RQRRAVPVVRERDEVGAPVLARRGASQVDVTSQPLERGGAARCPPPRGRVRPPPPRSPRRLTGRCHVSASRACRRCALPAIAPPVAGAPPACPWIVHRTLTPAG